MKCSVLIFSFRRNVFHLYPLRAESSVQPVIKAEVLKKKQVIFYLAVHCPEVMTASLLKRGKGKDDNALNFVLERGKSRASFARGESPFPGLPFLY